MAIDNDGVGCFSQAACCLCGRMGAVIHANLTDQLFGSPGKWQFRECSGRKCGLLWLDPMPLTEELSKLYQTYYTHTVAGVSAPTRKSWRKSFKRILSKIAIWRKYVYLSDLSHLEGMTPGRVLEVGCGNGAFLREAIYAGWRAVGIDFDAGAVAAAQGIPNAEAYVGDLLSARFPSQEFDAIVMNHVIEHLPSPQKVFDECERVLKPGGRLVMVTPNTRSLGYGRYQQDWRGLEVPRHLHLFSPATLAECARRARFSKIAAFSSSGGRSGIHCLAISRSLKEQRTGKVAAPDSRVAKAMNLLEVASIFFGSDVGEYAVLVAHK